MQERSQRVCEDVTQKRCEIHPFSTKPVTLALEGEKPNFKLKFSPSAGSEAEMATVSLSGECLVKSIEIKGSMACNYPAVEEEQHVHVLEFTASSGSKLKHLGESVALTGIDHFWIATPERKWSVK
jgi:hypothetical protein